VFIHLRLYVKEAARILFIFYGNTAPSGQGSPHFRGFTITLRHSKLDRTPLHGWSARHTYLSLTKDNTYKTETSMFPVDLESSIPASEWLQTSALNRICMKIIYIWHCYFTNNSRRSEQWEPSISMRTRGQEGRTDIRMLIIAFCKFVSATEISVQIFLHGHLSIT
jgi:hypothetical protein